MTAQSAPASRLAPRTSAFARMLRTEARLYLRDPGSWFFSVAFPPLMLTVLGLVMPWADEPYQSEQAGTAAVSMITGYTPSVLVLGTVTVALNAFPITIAAYRQRGVLRRLSTTPVSPSRLLAAQVLVQAAALLVSAALALVLGVVVAGVELPVAAPVVLLGFVLGALATFGIGSLIAALAPTTGAATGIGTTLMFLGMFFGGVWLPLPIMPEAVQQVAAFLPPGAAGQIMLAGWIGADVSALHVVVLVVWTAVTIPLAGRLFRWGD